MKMPFPQHMENLAISRTMRNMNSHGRGLGRSEQGVPQPVVVPVKTSRLGYAPPDV